MLKTYMIYIEEMDGNTKEAYRGKDPSWQPCVLASSPANALRMRGLIPDYSDARTSGAEPRNEYGHPWYPYYRAIEVSGATGYIGQWWCNDEHGWVWRPARSER